MVSFELSILDWIQTSLRSGFGDVFFPIITTFADEGIGWVLLCGILILIPKTKKLGGVMFLAIIIEVLACNIILKPLVARPRPFMLNSAVQLLIPAPEDYSFPSGHTAVSFAAASVLLVQKSKGWLPALLMAGLIAFSRLYLYVHFPTDVIAGAVIGIAAGALACRLWAFCEKRLSKKVQRR